jgi:hypothetical protein
MSAAFIALLTAALVLDTAHTVAPIVMAWAHPGFRRVMLGRQVKLLIVPSAVLAATIVIGLATSAGLTGYDLRHPHQMQRITGLDNPFPLIVWLYWAWNIPLRRAELWAGAADPGVGWTIRATLARPNGLRRRYSRGDGAAAVLGRVGDVFGHSLAHRTGPHGLCQQQKGSISVNGTAVWTHCVSVDPAALALR